MARMPLLLAAVALAVGLAEPARGQTAAAGQSQADVVGEAVALAAKTARVAEQPALFTYANRPIVLLRANVLSRAPAGRAAAAVELLDRFVEQGAAGRVTTRTFADGILVAIDGQPVVVVFNADVDPLSGEQLQTKASDAAARLQTAFAEAVELRTPSRLVRSVLLALGASVLYAAALWVLVRLDRRVAARVSNAAERQLKKHAAGHAILGVADAPAFVRRAFTLGGVLLGLVFTYIWLSAMLRQFPYTRPWGESLRTGLFSVVASASSGIVGQLPNLFTVLVIVVITRFFARLTTLLFNAVEQGRVVLPWIYPETAQPTRRIVVLLLWLFALIISYKYLPGSNTEAFKGVSVFVGLIVSLGSTGLMNQAMSGLMVTYSRALRVGDFVNVADVEGTVVQLGALSTKIRTNRNEEVTIPNAIVVSNATTNYSRLAASDGVFVPTSVTIGYDTPWRQVHALLLLAAERTPGVRPEPKPKVLQTALRDFYVEYRLLVCLDQPHQRYRILDALHANIQDAFNEYGVQIMSPNYEADPSGPKVVPPSRWYSAPAAPAGALAGDTPATRRTVEERVSGR
jgi:small-conductance mechanosensitive channel